MASKYDTTSSFAPRGKLSLTDKIIMGEPEGG
uniref:Uncharacterized protein n=1 Tax=Lepeophtheirus salmonis TaxID=72036 RepID=A0A0K2TL75_LEPSM